MLKYTQKISKNKIFYSMERFHPIAIKMGNFQFGFTLIEFFKYMGMLDLKLWPLYSRKTVSNVHVWQIIPGETFNDDLFFLRY